MASSTKVTLRVASSSIVGFADRYPMMYDDESQTQQSQAVNFMGNIQHYLTFPGL